MAVSKRPAWTKRETISSADELPVETEKSYLVQKVCMPMSQSTKAMSGNEHLRVTVSGSGQSSILRPLPGLKRVCPRCPWTPAFLPATATADGSCWARVRRIRAKEHSFSRSPSSRISICRLARRQRKMLSIPKVQRKCLSSVTIHSVCQFPLNINSMSIPEALEGKEGAP